jgi:hypothetical protein
MKGLVSVICILLFCGHAYAFDGLMGHYPFNGNADDLSGRENHGIVSGARLVEDRFGNPESAYLFGECGYEYIRIPYSPDFELESWTISGWIKIENPVGQYVSMLVKKGEDDYGKYNFGVVFHPKRRRKPNVVNAHFESCSSEYDHPLVQTNLPFGQWLFFCSVQDEETGERRLYIGEKVVKNTSGDVPCTNQEDIFIGYNFSVYSESFHGVIDDIRIYDRALSDREVRELREVKK